MTVYSGIRTFMKCPHVPVTGHYANPDVYIMGVPFDIGTSNRPGARFGPAAIRDASLMLDGGNPNFRLDPLKELQIYDAGDVDVSSVTKEALKQIEEAALAYTDRGAQLITMGGDHTISLPLLRAVSKRHKEKVCLVHFDAHVDTWTHHNGEKYRHGTPFHFAAKEKLIDTKHSIQVGIRSPIDNETMDYTRDKLGFKILTAENVHETTMPTIAEIIRNRVGDRPVYLTFDIDAIDPSQAPGTGTPEIGGLFTWQVLSIMRQIKELNWVGMDLVEVAPAYDNAQVTALAGATFIWTYLSMIASKRVRT